MKNRKPAVKRQDCRETAVLPKYEIPEKGKGREKAVITKMERRRKGTGGKR